MRYIPFLVYCAVVGGAWGLAALTGHWLTYCWAVGLSIILFIIGSFTFKREPKQPPTYHNGHEPKSRRGGLGMDDEEFSDKLGNY